jgi:glycosyl transferase family 2
MATASATLTVVMPNYNHAHFLPEALRAILTQSRRPDQVIVVDDASADDSVRILEQLAASEPILKVIKHDQNRGVARSVMRGLEEATGDYVYCSAADDRVLPGLFEKCMNALALFPQSAVCTSVPAVIRHSGDTSEHDFKVSPHVCYWSPSQYGAVVAKTGLWMPSHTAIMKKKSLLEVGGLLDELKWHCDWFALSVMTLREGMCYVPETLALFRLSETGYFATSRMPDELAVLRRILDLLESPGFADIAPAIIRSGMITRQLISVLPWDDASRRELEDVLRKEMPALITADVDSQRDVARRWTGQLRRLVPDWTKPALRRLFKRYPRPLPHECYEPACSASVKIAGAIDTEGSSDYGGGRGDPRRIVGPRRHV